MEKKQKINFEGKLHIVAAVVLILSSVMIWMGYGQDIEYHAERIAAIAQEMKIHPGIYRIYTTNSGGYGYASPLFYGDIFMYPAAFLVALGVDIAIAFRLFLASIMLASYLSMYFCVNSVWGRRTAVLAAYLYAFSPILLADIFIRFAVGEALAFVFLPIVLLGFYRAEEAIDRLDSLIDRYVRTDIFPYYIHSSYRDSFNTPLHCLYKKNLEE